MNLFFEIVVWKLLVRFWPSRGENIVSKESGCLPSDNLCMKVEQLYLNLSTDQYIVRYNRLQYSAVQSVLVQYSTMLHSTLQYSTVQLIIV